MLPQWRMNHTGHKHWVTVLPFHFAATDRGFGGPWAVKLQATLSQVLAKDILLPFVSVVGLMTLPIPWRTFGTGPY